MFQAWMMPLVPILLGATYLMPLATAGWAIGAGRRFARAGAWVRERAIRLMRKDFIAVLSHMRYNLK
jgi:hypothetical protein